MVCHVEALESVLARMPSPCLPYPHILVSGGKFSYMYFMSCLTCTG